MDGPSEHLSWKELACKDGTPYPIHWRATKAVQLAGIFEFLRVECGNKPIKVVSAYRTPSYNAKVGGVKNSQHIQGRALDLTPPKGMSIDDFYRIIDKFARVLSIRGIGKYKTFIHIDTRISDRIARW